MSDKIAFVNIDKLYTLKGGVRTRKQLENVEMIENAYLRINGEKIEDAGAMKTYIPCDERQIDCSGKIILPGFIDAHSHLVFAGDRTHEYAMKIHGASYLEIYESGGGIHSTVKATRAASFDELYEKAKKTVLSFLSCGVTTLEAKSGYGLNLETEIKQLKVIKKLNEETVMELVPTFMPAHALPLEYADSEAFLNEMIENVLPSVMKENLAEYMDCFLEKGVFDQKEAEMILQAGKKAGLKIKIHVDEIEDIGGVDTAVKLGAVSVEHCMVTSPENMEKLSREGIAAVILPATSFNLCKPYADVRTMIDKGVLLALSCDYNPGSSPCSDPIWMARIASRGCRLTPHEVLSMMTINAAKAINREARIGSLDAGKQADFMIMNAASFDEVIAIMGQNPIEAVYKKEKSMLEKTTKELLDAVDSASAVPGGGSVSALVGAFGVCLARMYGHLTVSKKRFLALDESIQKEFNMHFDALKESKKRLGDAIMADCAAYEKVMAAYKLPKDSEQEIEKRRLAIYKATISAIESPYAIMNEAIAAMHLCAGLIEHGNVNAVSDLACGAILLDAAVQGAGLNVQINLSALLEEEKADWSIKMQCALKESYELKESIVRRASSFM